MIAAISIYLIVGLLLLWGCVLTNMILSDDSRNEMADLIRDRGMIMVWLFVALMLGMATMWPMVVIAILCMSHNH